MVRKWVLQYNDGITSIHDEARNGQSSVVNNDLVDKMNPNEIRSASPCMADSRKDRHVVTSALQNHTTTLRKWACLQNIQYPLVWCSDVGRGVDSRLLRGDRRL
ncbi:hypothetical protein TNCV_1822221 [Trichonephila clavipes]|nr:hypothetical protein TNCV_1822221 [Trichonephila clavipes]